MLEYDRIDTSEEIDINKTNGLKKCDICHYWYFLDKNFKYEPYLCNGCHNFMQKAMNFNDVSIGSAKRSDHRIHFWYISKTHTINILKNYNVNVKRVIIIDFFYYI